MRLVRQLDSGGCVVASLAMACGLTYEQVRADISNFDERNSANFRDTEAFLFKHGYTWQQVWQFMPPGNSKRDPWPLQPWADVHMVEVRMPGNTHSVVLLRDGTVLDPLCDEPKRLSDYAEVYSMRAVYKAARPEEKTICGSNSAGISPETTGGCGLPIHDDIYRCADCGVPFHRAHIRQHFGEAHSSPQKTIFMCERVGYVCRRPECTYEKDRVCKNDGTTNNERR